MRKIIAQQRITARDQNKVFVERANAKPHSAADAEDYYGLQDGCGNAYIEFEVEERLLRVQTNSRLGIREYFIVGDVDLTSREAEARFNF